MYNQFYMFDILVFMLVFMAVGYLFEKIYHHSTKPLKTVLSFFAFFGVIIHELSHYIVCKLSGVKTINLMVKLNFWGEINPHGKIELDAPEHITFLQAVMVAFAPLYIGTIIFAYSLELLLYSSLSFFVKVILLLICISTLLTSNPSVPDLYQLSNGLSNDPTYAAYQTGLAIICGTLLWVVFWIFEIVILDLLFYAYLILMYLALKFGIRGIGVLLSKIHIGQIGRHSFHRHKIKLKKTKRKDIVW